MGQRNKIMDLVDTWPPNSMDLTLIPEGREPQEGDEIELLVNQVSLV